MKIPSKILLRGYISFSNGKFKFDIKANSVFNQSLSEDNLSALVASTEVSYLWLL